MNWLGQGAMLTILLEQGDKHFKYLILPHIAVSDYRPENRVGLVKLLIERHDVSQATSTILSRLLPEIESPDPLLWCPAALEASKALLSDFHYTLSTFRQGPAQGLDQLTVSNLWEAIFSPRLETTSDYLPVLLQHSMEFTDLIDRVRRWSVKLQGKPVIAIFEPYRQQVGLVPFGPPLDAWTVLADVTGVFGLSNLDSVRNLAAVIRAWAQKHHDPFCLLTGLTFLLCLRNHALDKGLGDLADERFREFVGEALKPIMITESQSEEPATIRSLSWQFLSTFAPYWLQYLLKAKIPKKEVLPKAWWLAHVTFETLRMALAALPEDRQNALFNHLMNLTRSMIERANVESLLGMHPQLQELVKGLYFDFSHLLARATIATLSQGSQGREPPSTPFGGFKGPPIVVSQENLGLIIQEVARSTFWGEGQQIMDAEPELPCLWNSPSCVTGSRLLRSLSEVSIGELKEPEKDMLRIAETVAEPSYVEKQLAELPNDYDRYSSIDAGLLWAGVGNYVGTRGKIPPNFAVMWEEEKLKMLWGDDQRTRDFCLSKASELLVMLQRLGFEREANRIVSVFPSLPILEASDRGRETFCKHLALAIILGQSLSALQPLIRLAKEDNAIKKTLSNVRSEVRSLLPNLPIGRRSQARRFLRTLVL